MHDAESSRFSRCSSAHGVALVAMSSLAVPNVAEVRDVVTGKLFQGGEGPSSRFLSVFQRVPPLFGIPSAKDCSNPQIMAVLEQSTYCPLIARLDFPRLAQASTPKSKTIVWGGRV